LDGRERSGQPNPVGHAALTVARLNVPSSAGATFPMRIPASRVAGIFALQREAQRF
jgi:hypothetical protein